MINFRLTAAAHEAVDYDDWSNLLMMSNKPDYSCTYGYDLNGNITSLTRKGVLRTVKMVSTVWVSGEIDHLSMAYDGNRLRKVTDQCAELTYAGAMDFKDGADKQEEYLWDANGNMTRDRNKNIYSISYNVLNLPECIEYYDGHEVRYTYAADGRKLHVDYILNPYAIIDDEGGGELPAPDPEGPEGLTGMAGTLTGGDGLYGGNPGLIDPEPPEPLEPLLLMTRDWCGSHIYRNGVLERVENSYGYWADSCYHYRITDYQGNVRAVISQNGVLEEVNGYYPYGGLLGAPATGVQARKYGGKELDRENGLDWYDFEARYQDPMLPRFTTVDPKAEKYYNISPYAYCAGNPISFTDPTGCKILGVTKEDASMAVQNIRAIFSGEKFEQFRNLIVQSGKKQDGKSLAKISDEALSAAFSGISLNEDQQAMVDIVVNTINSKSNHYIEFVDNDEVVSPQGSDVIASECSKIGVELDVTKGFPASSVPSLGGEGITFPVYNGTHSVILTDPSLHPDGISVTTGHEIFGHGRSLTIKGHNTPMQQHIDAIQTDNLIRRMMGIPVMRNGTDHGLRIKIENPLALPSFR